MDQYYTHPMFPGIDTKANWMSHFKKDKDKLKYGGMLEPFNLYQELKEGISTWKDSWGQYQSGREYRIKHGIECDKSIDHLSMAFAEALNPK